MTSAHWPARWHERVTHAVCRAAAAVTLAALAALAGCVVQSLPTQAPLPAPSPSVPPPAADAVSVTLAREADELLARHRAGLQRSRQDVATPAALALLATRAPRRCLDRLVLQHLDGRGAPRMRSVIALQTLPSGAALVAHAGTTAPQGRAVREAWVDLHGVASLAYWNAPFEADGALGPLAAVALEEGRLFDPRQPFALRVLHAGTEAVQLRCRPGATTDARNLHPNLVGAATEYLCEGGVEGAPGTRASRTFLHEYAHYLPRASYDERGALLSRFELVAFSDVRCVR